MRERDRKRSFEGGDYSLTCRVCANHFIGFKSYRVCKACSIISSTKPIQLKIRENFFLTISGAHELKDALQQDTTHILSFTHPGNSNDVSIEHKANVKKVCVHDTYLRKQSTMGLTIPSRELVEEIIDWFLIIKKEWEEGGTVKVICQCQAGISRSTAMAYVLMVMLSGETSESARNLVKLRDIANPNPLMIKHAEDILKINLSSALKQMNRLRFTDY